MKAPPPGRRARGVIALELALILLMMLFFAPCLLTLGSAVRQFVVLDKVAYQAARQLAAMPRLQMARKGSYDQAEAQALAQVMAALADAQVSTGELEFEVDCDPGFCGSATMPQRLKVKLGFTVHPVGWDGLSGWLLGANGLQLQTAVVMRYEN